MSMIRIIKYVVILVILTILTGCSFYQKLNDFFFYKSDFNGTLSIKTDRKTYSPFMSSTIGIGLKPKYKLDRDLESVDFEWKTDYGYFISHCPPDWQINVLGSEIKNKGEKIFWSYPPLEIGKRKCDFKIKLNLLDTKTGKILKTDSIRLIWQDRGTAVIKE